MGPGLGELLVPLRCWRLALGLAPAAVFASRSLNELTRAYDNVVAPIVAEAIGDPAERARADRALRAMSMKIGLAMLNYARMSGSEQRPDVAALAGAITRLYDDLLDSDAGALIDARLSDLFGAKSFVAYDDMERLLAGMFHEIAERVGAQPDDTAVVALRALHEYQSLSLRQREPDVTPGELLKITRGKGAMANLTLCGLVKPEMDGGERELIMALGEAYQALDDYMDIEFDRRNGVTTLASLGMLSVADIGARMPSSTLLDY